MAEEQETQPRGRRGRRWRRIAFWTLTLGVFVVTGLYWYVTRPANLRPIVRAKLAEVWTGPIAFEAVSFSLWDGLLLEDVRFSLPEGLPALQRVDGPLEVMRVDHLTVPMSWRALLSGRVTPTRFDAHNLRATVIRSAENKQHFDIDVGGAGFSFANAADWPRVNIDALTLRVMRVEGTRLRLEEQWNLTATGQPRPQHEDATYEFIVQDSPPSGARELLHVVVNADAGTLSAELDWVPWATVLRVAPQVVPEAVKLEPIAADYDLSAELRMPRLVVTEAGQASGSMEIRRFSGVLPVEEDAGAARFLTFSNFSGSLRFDEAGATGRFDGRVRDAEVAIAVKLTDTQQVSEPATRFGNWVGEIAVSLTDLQVPEYDAHEAFTRSPRLPGPVRAFFHDYEPRGHMSAEARVAFGVASSRGERDIDYAVTLEAHDASVAFHQFPYRVSAINGHVHIFPDQIVLDELRGRHGSAMIVGGGALDEPKGWTGFHLNVRAINVPFDHALYDALPPDYRDLWHDALPVGLADVDVSIRRESSTQALGPKPLETSVVARMVSGSLQFEDNILRHASGVMGFDAGQLDVPRLRGTYRGAPIALHGQVGGSADDALRERWTFRLDGLQLERNERIAGYSTPDPRDAAADGTEGEIAFRGSADVWGEFWRPDEDDEPRHYYVTELRDGTLALFDSQRSWRVRDGSLRIGSDRQEISALHVTSELGDLTVDGVLERRPERFIPEELVIRAVSPPEGAAPPGQIGALLEELVPPRWRPTVTQIGLRDGGAITFVWRSADEQTNDFVAGIDLAVEAMRSPVWPLRLRDVQANIAFTPDEFLLHTASARYGESAVIELEGTGHWETGEPRFVLSANAREMPLNADFVDSLPEAVQRLVAGMVPRGVVDAVLDEVAITAGDPQAWQVRGGLVFRDANLDLGLPLTDFSGRIDTQRPTHVKVVGEDVEARALFTIEDGALAGRALSSCTGNLRLSPDSQWLLIEQLSGMLCGGELRGQGRVDPETDEYRIEVSLRNIDFDAFVNPDREPNEQQIAARLDGRVFVGGVGGDPATRVGGGELRIRAVAVADTPVLASVAEASAQAARQLPNNADLIEIQFDWRGTVFHIRKVDIISPSVHLVGEGTWNIATNELNITLIGAPPGQPLAPPFNILDIAREELAQYRVTGTTENPEVSLEPLHNLADALRDVFGDERPPR